VKVESYRAQITIDLSPSNFISAYFSGYFQKFTIEVVFFYIYTNKFNLYLSNNLQGGKMSPWKIAGVEIGEKRPQEVFRTLTLTDLEPNTFYEIKTTVFETNDIFTEEILNFTTPNCILASKFDKIIKISYELNFFRQK